MLGYQRQSAAKLRVAEKVQRLFRKEVHSSEWKCPVSMTTKVCTHCQQEKPVSDFATNQRYKDGYYAYCDECVSTVSKEIYAKNREKRLAQMKAWKAANPEKVRAANQRWNAANGDLRRQLDRERGVKYPRRATFYHWKRYFGLTPEAHAALIAAQDGKCRVCGVAFEPGRGEKSAHVDHDHKSGKVRGIICRECNLGIGHFRDDLALLEKAVVYLRSFVADSDIVSSA